MKTYLTLLVLCVLSLNSYAQHQQGHNHDKHLDTLITGYMEMKDALVADDFEKAKQHLHSFTQEVKVNGEMNKHPEHAEMHAKHHSAMLAALQTTSEAENLVQLRESFDDITNELLKAIENQEYTRGVMYVQFCPMPNNGEGAKWLSKTENIQNPYMGQKMAGCGSTVKVIE